MATYIIGYSLIFIVVVAVIFIELVSHRVIFKYNANIQKIFGHPLLRYSLRRVGSALISILLAVTATFFLIKFKVDDNPEQICQTAIEAWAHMDPAVREQQCTHLLADLGFSENWFSDLMNYYYNILPFPKTVCLNDYTQTVLANGDIVYEILTYDCRTMIMNLGRVYFLPGSTNQYVSDVIISKMGVSFQIGIIAVVVQLVLGYPAGILMAKYKDGVFDKVGKAYIISIDAIPGVAYYYLWMWLFSAIALPTVFSPDNFLSYLAPSLTMGFTGMAGIALWVRRYMLDEFNSDYVKFARAKGLSENRIMYTHILRNAIVPLVRSIPSAVLGALLGSFYIEKIYAIDGVGGLLVQANTANDFYVLQGIIIVTALISICSYLLGDIVTAIIDPRIQLSSESE